MPRIGRASISEELAMRTLPPDEQSIKLYIRLPLDVKEWLLRVAARHCSSQNAELIRALRATMDRERAPESGPG